MSGVDDSHLWRTAIDDELRFMDEQHVWTIVPRPQQHTVGSKWVFIIKTNEHCMITRYKARLVAQGFSQKPSIDFNEIYAPVVHYGSLRQLLALAIENKWTPDQLDIKAAFLSGDLHEEISMELPQFWVGIRWQD